MKNAAFVMLTLFSISNASAETLFEKYPQNKSFILQSGAEVRLPLHFYESSMRMFTGAGNFEPIDAAVRSIGLYPIRKGKNRALVNLLLVDHVDTSIGPYREAILTVPVTSEPKNWALPSSLQGLISFLSVYIGGPSDHYGIFIWKVLVDTQIALDAGIEIWGISKWMANFDLDAEAPSLNDGGELVAQFDDSRRMTAFPLNEIDYYAYSPTDTKETRARCVGEAQAWSRKLKAGEGVRYAPGGPLTGTLVEIQFQADRLVLAPDQQTVFFGPEE